MMTHPEYWRGFIQAYENVIWVIKHNDAAAPEWLMPWVNAMIMEARKEIAKDDAL